MENKIDFVIIWVDGNDPEWREEKNKYRINNIGDGRNIRYRDWENLKYWFRGVEKYASWVNKIHFVTWGHLPDWLDTSNPKLNIVNHKDFIPEEYLPTFSANPIELNLHRIKGLEEQFVYFNDDMFIINNVEPKDFFVDGKPCDSAILSPAIKDKKDAIGNIVLNDMAIVNTYFDKNIQMKSNLKKWFNYKYEFKEKLKNVLLFPWNSFTGFYEFHLPSSFLKSTYNEIWDKEFEELNETSTHKFRDLKLDVNQWLIRDWQLASNNFVPRSTKFGKLFTLNKDTNLVSFFKKMKYKVVCLNDDAKIDEELFEKMKNQLKESFSEILPDKCSFEK